MGDRQEAVELAGLGLSKAGYPPGLRTVSDMGSQHCLQPDRELADSPVHHHATVWGRLVLTFSTFIVVRAECITSSIISLEALHIKWVVLSSDLKLSSIEMYI